MTHSSSKSSAKNKRAKQKAKLKTESIDNEACVQEKKLDHDGNPGGNTKELKVANERPTVAETITLIGNTDNALTSEQNGGVLKSENRETEMAAPAEVRENVEKKSSPDAKSVNTRGLGEVETLTNSVEVVNLIKNEGVNLSNGHESEKKQEAIIPLRSRGEWLFISLMQGLGIMIKFILFSDNVGNRTNASAFREFSKLHET